MTRSRKIVSYHLALLIGVSIFSVADSNDVFAANPNKQAFRLNLSMGEQAQLAHDYLKSAGFYIKAIAEAQKYGDKSPEVQEAEARLAIVYVLDGKLQLAEPHYQKAKDLASEMLKNGWDEPESFVWLDDLSDAYQLIGATKEPFFCYERCAQLRREISPRHKNLATAKALYGAELLKKNRKAEGDKNLQDAYDLVRKLTGEESMNTGLLCLLVANAYNNAGDYRRAEKYCGAALTIAEKRTGADSEVVANVARLQASILANLGRIQEAEQAVNKAMQIHKRRHGVRNIEYAYDLACLARVYFEGHRLAEAEKAYSSAIEIIGTASGALPQIKADTLDTGAKIHRQLHHDAVASRLAAQAKSLRSKF